MLHTVVDNRYMGEVFAFVITNLDYSDRWKYSCHCDYLDFEEAQAKAERLNKSWGVE